MLPSAPPQVVGLVTVPRVAVKPAGSVRVVMSGMLTQPVAVSVMMMLVKDPAERPLRVTAPPASAVSPVCVPAVPSWSKLTS